MATLIFAENNHRRENWLKEAQDFVFKCWLSPNRKLVYRQEIVTISRFDDAGENNSYFFDEFYGGSVFDQFDETDSGLWVISGRVSNYFRKDHFGEIEHDFNVEEIFTKKKCVNFSHLREQWSQLKHENTMSSCSGFMDLTFTDIGEVV